VTKGFATLLERITQDSECFWPHAVEAGDFALTSLRELVKIRETSG